MPEISDQLLEQLDSAGPDARRDFFSRRTPEERALLANAIKEWKSRPSEAESLYRGGVQGATAKFSDEIVGAAKAIGIEPGRLVTALAGGVGPLASYVGSQVGDTFDSISTEDIAKTYRKERDAERARNAAADTAHPNYYLAGEIGGGIVGGAPIAAPATVLGATAAGAGFGGATALGESEADLTRGEYAQAAKDTAAGTAVGAGAGLLTAGLAKGAKAAYRAARGTRGIEKLAEEVGQSAANAVPVAKQPSPRTFYEKSLEITKQAGDDIFSPSEATGDPALALAESKALQFPKTMRTAQAQRNARLENTARFLDKQTDSIAADPSKLGRADLSDGLASSVQRHIDDLKEARSAAARPLFEEAEKLSRGQRVVPLKNTLAALDSLIDQYSTDLGTDTAKRVVEGLEKQRQDIMRGAWKEGADALKTGAPLDQTARVSVKSLQRSLEIFGKAKRGTGDVIADMDKATNIHIASVIKKALDADLSDAAKGGLAAANMDGAEMQAATAALVKARDTWAKHSQAIADLPLEALGKIIKVGSGEAGDTLVDKMLTMSPEQLGGVARVLQKTDPAMLKQANAEMVETLLTRAGKAPRGSSIGSEVGAVTFRPSQALGLLAKNEARLRAIQGGDKQAEFALRRIMETLKRKSTTPGLQGSQTAPLIAQVVDEATDVAATAAAGPKAGMLKSVIKSLVGDEKAIVEAVTDPAKLKLLDEAIQLQMQAGKGMALSESALRGLLASANRLGLIETESLRESLSQNTRQKPKVKRVTQFTVNPAELPSARFE